MGHIDVAGVHYFLPDGRPLLGGVSLRVGEGAKVALVGPNGTGKTTLLRIIAGELDAHEGAITRSGGLAIMPQFIGRARPEGERAGRRADQGHRATESTTRNESSAQEFSVRDLLLTVAPGPIRQAAKAVDDSELAIMERDDEPAQLAYAQALADWAEIGGYEWETLWDVCTVAAIGIPYDRAQFRDVSTLSGGEQKRIVLEALLRGPEEVLLLDEPDNSLDVPTKRWLEEQVVASPKTVLFISHDREMLANVATRIATLEPAAAGANAWVHPGSFTTYHQARIDRISKLEEMRRRWDEEHAKLKQLVQMYKIKAAYNSDMAARYRAAQTRLAKFEEAGPPEVVPFEQHVSMRLAGGRTAKRAVICEGLELSGLMKPFDLEVWYGERVAVLGSNGSGKSHFLRLLARGGSDPDIEHRPVGDNPPKSVAHNGIARLGSRVRPGWFAQSAQAGASGAWAKRTLLEILHRGDEHRDGMPREQASRALDRYELARAAEQTFGSLSGGQQARFQILLLELSGATLLLLDEPTDNLDLHSAEALEAGLDAFNGTVVAVTHDRWFARGFDRFLVFGADGRVREANEPVWDEERVDRVR